MEWSKPEDVLGFKIWVHAQDIVEGHLRSGEASPVQWSAVLQVFDVDVHASLVQVVDAKWLVLLGGNVHCSTALISDIQVSSSLFYQQTQDIIVAVLSREMESCEIVLSGVIDPILHSFNLVLLILACCKVEFPSILKNDFEAVGHVPVGSIGEEGELLVVLHVHQIEWVRL